MLESKAALWTGRVLSALIVLFLLMDGVMKVMRAQVAIDATQQLGYPAAFVFPLGVMILAIMLLYAVPQTAVLGAILLTGLAGGTAATHLIAGNPLTSHVLFGIYLSVIAWAGLWLRDARLRALIPISR